MIKPLLMPWAEAGAVRCHAPVDLRQAFERKLVADAAWAEDNQYLHVWLTPERARVEAARQALLRRAASLAGGENDATENHTWCLAPHALRVAAYATWVEALAPWSAAQKERLGRDLVQFCRQHVVAVLAGRAPSADNQYLSLSLTCAIVGEGLRRLGVEKESAAWLSRLGLERARLWIGVMPPDGYSGEGSTYHLEVVGPLAMWLCMLLVEQEGPGVLARPFGPNGTTLAAILDLQRDLASPAGVAPGWDSAGWTPYYTLAPLVYRCRVTGEPVPEALIRQQWDAFDTIAWRPDDRMWTLLCWPEERRALPIAPAVSGWTRPQCAAVIDHMPTRSRLMLCADRTAEALQAVGRYQCNPNHLLWEVDGVAVLGDGGKQSGARLASDVAGLRARLEPQRLERLLHQYGDLEAFLAAIDTGLPGMANTVIVGNSREWFPLEATAGTCVWEARSTDGHAVAFDCRALYDPALSLRIARRFIAMDAAGVGWVVDDYRADDAQPWTWQVYVPPTASLVFGGLLVPTTGTRRVMLGWPRGEVAQVENVPAYPSAAPHGVWSWNGSRRVTRRGGGAHLRLATVLLPFEAVDLEVRQIDEWQWEACWRGGRARIAVPDLGDAPAAIPAVCPPTMTGDEPVWVADPACATVPDAQFLSQVTAPAPGAWRDTVRALLHLALRGNRAVGPAAEALLRDQHQKYHVHSVACRVLGAIPDGAAVDLLEQWRWAPEPNIAVRAREALVRLDGVTIEAKE